MINPMNPHERVERIIYTESKNPGYLIGGFILGVGTACAAIALFFMATGACFSG